MDELELAHATALATGLGHPNIVPVIGDLIDAHLDAGHHARAVELVEWVAGRAAAARLVYPATVVARSRGRLATDAETASRCFATARRLHGRRGTPFERAQDAAGRGHDLAAAASRVRGPHTAARVAHRIRAARCPSLGGEGRGRADRRRRAAATPPSSAVRASTGSPDRS